MNKAIFIVLPIVLLAIGAAFVQFGAKTNDTIADSCAGTDTCKVNFANASASVKEFTLNATRFQYSPETITVSKGDRVRIRINNIDALHGIRIPEFGVGDKEKVEFIADKTGEFDFYCTVFCGSGHNEMKGKLVVQ
jgi:cytochrome c oxidase subunit 2